MKKAYEKPVLKGLGLLRLVTKHSCTTMYRMETSTIDMMPIGSHCSM
jgi:hypothetical protein